jgi:hypothetical protein
MNETWSSSCTPQTHTSRSCVTMVNNRALTERFHFRRSYEFCVNVFIYLRGKRLERCKAEAEPVRIDLACGEMDRRVPS